MPFVCCCFHLSGCSGRAKFLSLSNLAESGFSVSTVVHCMYVVCAQIQAVQQEYNHAAVNAPARPAAVQCILLQ